jgi:hypothetical protein
VDPGQTGPDPERRTAQRAQCQTKQSQQCDLHVFFLSGRGLVMCHGWRGEVQRRGELNGDAAIPGHIEDASFDGQLRIAE